MKILTQLKKNEGFTLVELMISVVIMAIAFAGLATMQIACINGNSIASNLTTGITLAQDKMEELNTLPDTDPPPAALADTNPQNNVNLNQAICGGGISYPECASAGTPMYCENMERDVDEDGKVNADGGMYTRIWNVARDTPIPGRHTVVVIVIWKNHRVTVSSIVGAPFS